MTHIVQSPIWGEFKTKMGTPAVIAGGIQYTKHKIPRTKYFYAYAPKVDPLKINWDELKKSLVAENCIGINFDVPNVLEENARESIEIFERNGCINSPKDTFARATILLDLSPSEEEILSKMHKKHKYNINYAAKSGVEVYEAKTPEDFETFYSLLENTAKRQKYLIHSRSYYKNAWEILGKENKAHILIAKHGEKALSAWMFFYHDGILYYPYGGSSAEMKNLQHSLAVAWEGIRLGKKLGCKEFDMWGASENPEDTKDHWYGFTQFKLKFGGKYVRYMGSYDLPINKSFYKFFNLANKIRWTILKILK